MVETLFDNENECVAIFKATSTLALDDKLEAVLTPEEDVWYCPNCDLRFGTKAWAANHLKEAAARIFSHYRSRPTVEGPN